jgi:deoxyribodipyrimidine photo-lyase
MSKKFENGLFIFRRDFRIIDNNGLNFLSNICNNIYPIFIFTPEQVGNSNQYKSNNAIQFMIESLEDLSKSISKNGGNLYTFYGDNIKIIKECINKFNIDIIVFNFDITPYSRERDIEILKLCKNMDIHINMVHDYYLQDIGNIKNGSGNFYVKFTPFYLECLKRKVSQPQTSKKYNFISTNKQLSHKISLSDAMKKFTKINNNILYNGGRENGLIVLKQSIKTQKNYHKTRDYLKYKTTQLSPFIKFGCISIREVYKALHNRKEIIRQLYWRDFYANVLYSHPKNIGHSMKPNYNKIKWHHNSNWFNKWCNGETGFPIVDAGMKQLNITGYMHNRVRLVVSSFLTKILLIDWRYGEKYFAQKLIDYDPASNNGNWQWTASTGVDSQPYFRILNPWLQTEKLDNECIYIKTWLPELENIDNNIILKWYETYENNKNINYPKPICNYVEQKEKALKMYKSL